MARTVNELIESAHSIIDEANNKYKPLKIFSLFSGGHDSLSSTHVSKSYKDYSGGVHIDTTIGVKETRDFVQTTCNLFNIDLKIYQPLESYEKIIMKKGFPGPPAHTYIYNRLKERCIWMLLRDVKKGKNRGKVGLITGVRKSESIRRMGYVKPIQVWRGMLWIAPIYDWTDEEKHLYIQYFNLPKNPVVGRLCFSGECLCGCFAQPDEIVLIEKFYPETAKEIHRLEQLVRDQGLHCTWGTSLCDKRKGKERYIPMCWSCQNNHEDGVNN